MHVNAKDSIVTALMRLILPRRRPSSPLNGRIVGLPTGNYPRRYRTLRKSNNMERPGRKAEEAPDVVPISAHR